MAELKKSEINIEVLLDPNRVPEAIYWSAEDGNIKREEAKAMMLSMWDPKQQETLRIDLWTKEMPVDEMKKFTCQNIITMADSFERATGEIVIANEIRLFGEELAVKLGVMKR